MHAKQFAMRSANQRTEKETEKRDGLQVFVWMSTYLRTSLSLHVVVLQKRSNGLASTNLLFSKKAAPFIQIPQKLSGIVRFSCFYVVGLLNTEQTKAWNKPVHAKLYKSKNTFNSEFHYFSQIGLFVSLFSQIRSQMTQYKLVPRLLWRNNGRKTIQYYHIQLQQFLVFFERLIKQSWLITWIIVG